MDYFLFFSIAEGISFNTAIIKPMASSVFLFHQGEEFACVFWDMKHLTCKSGFITFTDLVLRISGIIQ